MALTTSGSTWIWSLFTDDVRRRRGAGLAARERGFQLCVIVWHVDAGAQRTEHEKRCQSIEDNVVRSRHHRAGVLGFTGCHGDVVWPGDSEGGLDQALQEAEKTAEVTGVVELSEGTRILSAKAIM